MDTRRDFIKKASLLSAGSGLLHVLPASVARALAIDPAPGTTYLDAEHIVFLMQENRSFDHTYGTLQGVRGFNDPRAITIPGNNRVWLQTNEKGETYLPFRYDINGTKITWMNSLPHSWSNQVDARNNGKYDKWLEAKPSGHDEYKAMPLTMGYYSRQDIPFYYSLADAFTVCDQHFCSSLTGTTPNRLYFWTGTIREKPDEKALARVWNEDADYGNWVNWKTFPERLEENGVSWKIYQNELSVGVGFEGEEDDWLGNFTDNPIEFFSQYQVKFHPEYIAALPRMAIQLKEELAKKQQELAGQTTGTEEYKKLERHISWLQKRIQINAEDQQKYTREKYEQLTPFEKAIHEKAFTNNRKDPHYHELTTLNYKDGNESRQVKVPKGDVLHQFREDVHSGKLPTVSWLVAPANYSDHPGAAWYGAWYISEAMDILTSNPEVWKKTIFILTYDENDGYFDHVPPFVAPHPYKKDTGAVSSSINTAVEFVAGVSQQSNKEEARESPIGLGYRVPMVIASPWSRGGWVNSQVFDHTSSLQFLEKFLSHKLNRKIEETNISAWRRAICGDLSSVFRPYNGEKINTPAFLDRDDFVKSIHRAQFKNPPSDFKKLTATQVAQVNKDAHHSGLMASQEQGIRSSCALPYELYADLKHDKANQTVSIILKAGKQVFGNRSAGSPFHVYAPGRYEGEEVRAWSYAVEAGDELKDNWLVNNFANGHYQLCVYGPNGFFRDFTGSPDSPELDVHITYEKGNAQKSRLTGHVLVHIKAEKGCGVSLMDNAYKNPLQSRAVAAGETVVLKLNTANAFGWYDFSVKTDGDATFERRYAGRVETGIAGKTDPLMGDAIK